MKKIAAARKTTPHAALATPKPRTANALVAAHSAASATSNAPMSFLARTGTSIVDDPSSVICFDASATKTACPKNATPYHALNSSD